MLVITRFFCHSNQHFQELWTVQQLGHSRGCSDHRDGGVQGEIHRRQLDKLSLLCFQYIMILIHHHNSDIPNILISLNGVSDGKYSSVFSNLFRL